MSTDFNFDIVHPFLDGDAPRRASYGLYIAAARVCKHVKNFNTRNKLQTFPAGLSVS